LTLIEGCSSDTQAFFLSWSGENTAKLPNDFSWLVNILCFLCLTYQSSRMRFTQSPYAFSSIWEFTALLEHIVFLCGEFRGPCITLVMWEKPLARSCSCVLLLPLYVPDISSAQ